MTLYRRQGARPSPRKRNAKKKNGCLFEEALQIAVKRKETKSKGEKERYTNLNAEFKEHQGKIRKPSSVISAKKERKTIEWERLEISSGKLDTKGTFHAMMGSIKDRNGRDLIETEDIMKRWQKKHRRTVQKRSS